MLPSFRQGNKPVDYGLAVAMPLHAHVGLNFVVSDYVPTAARGPVRAGLLGLTIASIAGAWRATYVFSLLPTMPPTPCPPY